MGPHDVAETYLKLGRPDAPDDETLLDAEAMCNDMLEGLKSLRLSRLAVYDMWDAQCQVLPSSAVAMAP